MIVCYPRLSRVDLACVRLLGPGLGNLLFPWARAAVAARHHGARIVWPTWPQLRIGSILRREQDTRFYFGLFRRPTGYIGGLTKVKLLVNTTRVSERDHLAWSTEQVTQPPRLIVFEGMDELFTPVLNEHRFLSGELTRIVNPRELAKVPARTGIAVHVRLGDFQPPSLDALGRGTTCTRIPLRWYVEMIDRLHASLGADRKVIVYSDGTDAELEPLLRVPRVRRAHHGSSVADMLALSRAAVLVASGSTFSMWASFLGRMPVIWYPGQLRQRLYPDSSRQTEIELRADQDLTPSFVRAALLRVDSAASRLRS